MPGRDPLPLTPLEEAILAWEQASVPWNVHMDITAPRLDPERLRAAFNVAIHSHELPPCAIEPDRGGHHVWVPDPAADIGPVPVVACADEVELDRIRLGVLEAAFDVGRAPLLRAVVARLPEHDVVITCVSHVLCDGLAVFRLMASVARAYTGEPDPPPAVDLRTARRLFDGAEASTWRQLGDRWSGSLALAGSLLSARSRMAPRGANELGGNGFVRMTVPAADVRAARRGRGGFDAYAMAALHVAVERWNRDLGAPAERVGIAQGVNLRPAEWFTDVVLNLAVAVSVQTVPRDRRSVDDALAVVGPQLAPDHRIAVARRMLDGARSAQVVPFAMRSRALAAASPDLFDTCVISNVGVQPTPRFDPAHEARSWGSSIAPPASGMTIAVGGVADDIVFDVRFRRERFDVEAAGAFLEVFAETLKAG